MMLRALASLAVIGAAHGQLGQNQMGMAQQHPAQSLSPQCATALHGLNDAKKREASAQCEQEQGFADKVIDHLQNGEESEAISVTEDSFHMCAGFSKECAEEVSAGVVQEIRFSGVAVSDSCRAKASKSQQDEKFMTGVHQCEQDKKVAENLLSALNSGDLDKAVGSAEHGLEECMKLPEECAFQIAPVLVNQVVTMAMMQQSGMMPVFVRTNQEVAATKSSAKTLSLLKVAMASRTPRSRVTRRGGRSFALLQQRRPERRVNGLVLELALEKWRR